MFASRGRLGSFRRLFPIVKDAERERSFPTEVCVMNAERNRWIEGQTLAKVLGIIVYLSGCSQGTSQNHSSRRLEKRDRTWRGSKKGD